MRTALILFTLLLAGCGTPQKPLAPARQYVLTPNTQVEQTSSENTRGSRVDVKETFHADGTIKSREVQSRSDGGQWFHVPDFTGENWTMYAGIGIAVLGVAMFFFPLTSPLAGWVIAGGIGMVALGSWLKSDMAPWVTGGIIVAGLAYAFYRNRKALHNAVQGIEQSGSTEAKQAVYRNTDHSDDKLIKGLV